MLNLNDVQRRGEMITPEEINLCIDYLMKHPDEAQEFLKTIGIKNSTHTYKGACCYPHEVKYQNNIKYDSE